MMHWVLFAVAFLGSAAAYTAVSRMFAPAPEGDAHDLSNIAKKAVGTSSSFSSLDANGGLLDEHRVNRVRYLEGTPYDSTRWIDTRNALQLLGP